MSSSHPKTVWCSLADQRYYNAGTGRFWSVDPSGMKAATLGIPTSWNMYSYSHGDPVNRYDPSGLHDITPDCPEDDPCPDDPGPCDDNPTMIGCPGYGGGGGDGYQPGQNTDTPGGSAGLPDCGDLLSTDITSFLSSVKSPLTTQDPGLVSQIMAEAEQVGVDPRLFVAETAESGWGTSAVAATMNNPFGLKGRGGNISYSSVGAAVTAEGKTLSTFVNTFGENLYQMYSGYPGVTNPPGWTWRTPPSYCQVAAGFVGPNACQQFGATVAGALTKMGGSPTSLKYPQGEVDGTPCKK
jgi:RHS repeat-associated protein